MKKFFALLLCILLLPLCAQAGDERDPFIDEGISKALKGTEWENCDHVWGVYLDTDRRAAAILTHANQRILAEFEYSGNAWHLVSIYPDAVCQSQRTTTYVSALMVEGSDSLDLCIRHLISDLCFQNYTFTREGNRWVFQSAALYNYMLEDTYDALRVAYYTWENGYLVRTWYIADAFGIMPDKKVEQPGGGTFIATELPKEYIAHDQITLDTFDIEAFPLDLYTQLGKEAADSDCAQKLGQKDPNAQYAVVNNPDPKTRLNLRTQPKTSASHLGKYYNGTVVEVISQTNSQWTEVRLDDTTTGYMMTMYLAFGSDAGKVESAMPVFTARNERWKLYSNAHTTSFVKHTFPGGETFEVMGFADGWWHIRCEGMTGYIKQYKNLE